jgi:hypothetical protein
MREREREKENHDSGLGVREVIVRGREGGGDGREGGR